MTCHIETGLPEHILEVAREPHDGMKAALERAGRAFFSGTILTAKSPLATAEAKSRAAELTGAIAVDMESAAIAYEAAVKGIPFACLRTILDTAIEDLPGASLADENGRVRPFAAAHAIVTNPAIITAGIRLLRNLKIAANAMGEAVAAAIKERD
jgi:nucleoside phosphorylase